MIFTDEFLSGLINDPIAGVLNIIETVNVELGEVRDWAQDDYKVLSEAYALISEMFDGGLLPQLTHTEIDVSGSVVQDCTAIYTVLTELERACQKLAARSNFASIKSRFRASLGTRFHYEFSQGDLKRIQQLINELRDLIAASDALESDHKQRLLKRLETLQAEMHKKVSDLDRFWGLVGEAGVVLGKFGTDAKPIVDRIREIWEIVWQTQSRAEELPSGTKFPLLDNKAGNGHE
ncbi:MAG TPA: hypothetical protein VEC35_15010 [Noviherbaspirillum sp.]|nr:hypothetical protein [Noviherbaspirillum sp.]